MNRTLTRDQAWALWRLQSLLERRCHVSLGMQTSIRPPEPLVHALDHAVLGALNVAQQLGLSEAAGALVHRYQYAAPACHLLAEPAGGLREGESR